MKTFVLIALLFGETVFAAVEYPTETIDLGALRKRAEAGEAIAQHNLGVCYHQGLGVSIDYKEAVKWFLKAAEQGMPNSLLDLSNCYANGFGVEKNLPLALSYRMQTLSNKYASATLRGIAAAAIGAQYMAGLGVPKNEIEGLAWEYIASGIFDHEGAQKLIEIREKLETRNTILLAQQRSKEILADVRQKFAQKNEKK